MTLNLLGRCNVCRTKAILSFVPLIALVMLLDLFGWTLDFDIVKTAFGFRKPGNPSVKGFAVTIAFVEFKVFKARV